MSLLTENGFSPKPIPEKRIIKFPGADKHSSLSIVDKNGFNLFTVLGNRSIGINQQSPRANLEVGGLNGFLSTGKLGSGYIINLGSGPRMHWYPKKAAFRVGMAYSDEWNDKLIGDYSFASGYNSIASGTASIAMGVATKASGEYSVAIGRFANALGDYSVAIGGAHANTKGSFVIADASPTSPSSKTDNQMVMKFIGGYIFYTSNITPWVGVQLKANGTSWSSVSDSTKKENFKVVNGEYFLNSISKLKLGSWNYKKQDPKKYRHYGPMAQEIYHFFGNDGIGVIGDKTLLASADMDGIQMIAIKALVKRTEELKITQQKLENKTAELVKLTDTINEQNKRIQVQSSVIKELQKDFNQIKKAFTIFINNSNQNVKSKLTMNK